MILVENKKTGVKSSYTNKAFKELQKHPDLLNRFKVLTPLKKEPVPPEVAGSTNNTDGNSTTNTEAAQADS